MKEKKIYEREKKLQVIIEGETLDKAKEKARQSGLTLSLVVRKLLEDYVANPQGRLIF